MKIVVCIKQVPQVTDVRFDPERKTIIREGVKNIVNPFDRRAVTKAIELVRQRGGEVVALTMGPPQAQEALVECLAMGADRAIHLCDRALAGSDTLVTARVLARAIQQRVPGFDLIFCGKHSIDAETGQVGPELAELLDLPQVCGLTSMELSQDGIRLRGERETDDGFELLECELPAVLTAAERLVRPIKVRDADLKAAQGKPLETLTAADVGLPPDEIGVAGSPTTVAAIRSIDSRRQVRFLSRDVEAAAEQLLDVFEERGVFASAGDQDELIRDARPVRHSGPEVWVTMEQLGGRFRSVSLELLGEAARLAERVQGQACAIIFGGTSGEAAKALGEQGADRVYILEHEALGLRSTEGYGQALAEAIERRQPYAVLCPSTSDGRAYAPRAAARLGLGLTGDCIGLEVDEQGRLVQLKPAFGGTIVAPILTRTTPAMATVRAGVFPRPAPMDGREADLEHVRITTPLKCRSRVLEQRPEAGQAGIELETAPIVIGVGLGLGAPEQLSVIEPLAARLGAAIGASRKVVDRGWLPRQQQIGLTGKSIAPKLYLAVALRGNLNHMIGVKQAELVVAVNNDPEADIFKSSDYGVVADYQAFIPALVGVLEKRHRHRQ